MAYKVVLLDDEPWTIVYIKKTFQWKEMGFEVVAEANNSLKALELIKEIQPDVLFTDIRMPEMSGLELMQEVMKQNIHCEFVIVSGFGEFAYAQEAIKLGVFEYCLKPISPLKAREILGRLAHHLASKTTEELLAKNQGIPVNNDKDSITEEEGKLHFHKMLEYMRSNFYDKLQLRELAKQFYMNPNYCCYLFRKYTGMTFSEYLTDLRMKEAEHLLLDKWLTIEEVADKAGYRDYFYFNKVFKKCYGVTPAQYRKDGGIRG